MNGYNRIKELYLNNVNKDKPLIKIVTYLMKREGMSEYYLKEEKNLEDMIKFIHYKAKEQAINNVAILEDETVYELAITYFTQSNEELGLVKTQKATIAKNKINEEVKDDKNQLTLEI